jgi:hypothetical protein
MNIGSISSSIEIPSIPLIPSKCSPRPALLLHFSDPLQVDRAQLVSVR